MWAAWVVAAIALAATAFMLRFLIALLREDAPSVCYWLVPVLEPEKEQQPKALRGIYFEDDRPATKSNRGDYRLELMENEHVMQQCTSGPTALTLRPVPDDVVWRSIQRSRGDAFRGRRL
jgi:hypothetical protein